MIIRRFLAILMILFILSLIVFMILPAKSFASWSFDSDSDEMKIFIALDGEQYGVSHQVDAIIIDDEDKTMTVLYTGEKRSITYPFESVREVMFFTKNGTGLVYELD